MGGVTGVAFASGQGSDPAINASYCTSGSITFEVCGRVVLSLTAGYCGSDGCTYGLIAFAGGTMLQGGTPELRLCSRARRPCIRVGSSSRGPERRCSQRSTRPWLTTSASLVAKRRPLGLLATLLVLAGSPTLGCTASESLVVDVAEHGESVRLSQFRIPEVFGEVAGGRACFWGSIEGREIALVWPQGSVAKSNPLRVLASDGTELARVGKPVAMGGTLGVATLRPCRAGAEVYLVKEVVHPPQ